MPHPCVVCGRSRMNPNNREEDYMFFGFPVNYESRCKKWLEFCCREDLYKLTKKQLLQRMVCSKHFERKDFLNEYQDRLNCTGVPSIYEPSQSLYNITCVLCGKLRKDPPPDNYDGTTFHHFPGEEFRCLKWLDFVNIDSYYRLTRKEILFCYICSNHFDKSQFMHGFKNRLVDNAVPNIRDPGQAEISKIDRSPDIKTLQVNDRIKRHEPLSTAVLESQACAACGRSRSDPRNRIERYKFHPFPAYEIGRCLRWCQFLGREDLLKMSPNQIRKLVLCSKHFLSGQSFHKVGPCDAVPTIKEITDSCTIEPQIVDLENDDHDEDPECEIKLEKSLDFQRPLVSSKKPKIENKPAPLAKKRGRSKRPISINLPKLDNLNIENRIRKMPIPPTNWKIQLANNQFQPLTIANGSNALTTDGKKVILPFAGNISNLGAPIPVHSLSSIPPGFLIKINLPEQTPKKRTRAPRKQKIIENEVASQEPTIMTTTTATTTSIAKPARRRRAKKKVDRPTVATKNIEPPTEMRENIDPPTEIQKIVNLPTEVPKKVNPLMKVRKIVNPLKELPKIVDTSMEEQKNVNSSTVQNSECIVMSEFQIQKQDNEDESRESCKQEMMNIVMEENIEQNMIEVLGDDFDELEEDYATIDDEDQIEVYEEIPVNEDQMANDEIIKEEKPRIETGRRMMTPRTRRTLLPIRTEVRYFLHKLKPHMRRLPRKARAQLKLSIVNLVIDRL